MAELSKTMAAVLDAVTLVGPRWIPQGDEGPRRIGLCVYCHGVCNGATTDCETRVWHDAKVSRK